MAGIPKVKIQFDADLDGLRKGTNDADKEVAGFADKVGEFGKKAAAAFAVAAAAAVAYAGKLAIDGVKAAIEDEQAQLKLAGALEKATGATNAQIKAVEDQILKTSLATGVADDKLRPALQRLVVATGDTEKAQKLLNTALDVSAATGKPLEAVSNALGKAYEGNTTALGRLQVGISATEAKTLGYTGSLEKLTELYGGAAARNADTYQGRIDRIKVAFDETKESIGVALLPILEKLLGFVTNTVLPNFQKFSDALSGSGEGILARFTAIYNYIKDFVTPIFEAVRGAFNKIGEAIAAQKPNFEGIVQTLSEIYTWANKYIVPILRGALVQAVEFFGSTAATAIRVVVPIIEGVYNAIKSIINGIIDVINTAIAIYNRVNFAAKDLSPISKIGEGTTSTGLGSRPLGTATSTATGSLTGGLTGGSIAGGIVGGAVGGATVAGNIATKAANAVSTAAKAIDDVAGAFDTFGGNTQTLAGIEALSNPAFQFGTSGVNTNTLAGVLAASARPNINLTVNGAIDPESTARQIIDILNDSQARGTVGAGALVSAQAI